MPKRRYRKSKRVSKKTIKQMVRNELSLYKETKYFDYSQTSPSITNATGTAIIPSFQIAQGTGDQNRIGDKIMVKGMKYIYNLNATVSASVRLICVLITPYSTAINSQVSTDFNAIGLTGFYPRDINGYKYKILYDKMINIDPDKNGSITFQKYIKLNRKLNFKDATTTSTNLDFKVLWFQYTNNTTASAVSSVFNSRLLFKED